MPKNFKGSIFVWFTRILCWCRYKASFENPECHSDLGSNPHTPLCKSDALPPEQIAWWWYNHYIFQMKQGTWLTYFWHPLLSRTWLNPSA